MKHTGWFVLSAGALVLLGCGSSGVKNRTFYDWADAADAPSAFERAYPPLDWQSPPPHPGFVGVSLLADNVRLSRPRNWFLQTAANDPGEAFVQYVSPNAYSFAVYERRDSPGDSWSSIQEQYEKDVAAAKAKIVAEDVPIATGRGQGRAYTLEREVEASKLPFISRSREMLVRGEENVVLIQIVYQSEDLSDVDAELLRSVGTLEVL